MKTEDRAAELFAMPMKDVPKKAINYMNHLGKQMGLCGEVCIHAYKIYAYLTEGLCYKEEKNKPKDEEVKEYRQLERDGKI